MFSKAIIFAILAVYCLPGPSAAQPAPPNNFRIDGSQFNPIPRPFVSNLQQRQILPNSNGASPFNGNALYPNQPVVAIGKPQYVRPSQPNQPIVPAEAVIAPGQPQFVSLNGRLYLVNPDPQENSVDNPLIRKSIGVLDGLQHGGFNLVDWFHDTLGGANNLGSNFARGGVGLGFDRAKDGILKFDDSVKKIWNGIQA